MKVLITGHRGFVGRHLWQACVQRGYSITGVDIAAADNRFGGGFELTGLDCRHYFADRYSRHYDLVLHCAATVGGRETIDGNPIGVATNLALDVEMFNWALRTKVGRVVYFSSSAVYPVRIQMERGLTGEWRRLAEGVIAPDWDTIGRPDQTYGWAKLTGELVAAQVNAAGIPVHVFRPFSGYGTDQSLVYPFGAFLDRARGRADPFIVWGGGTQVRDWIHIDDIVDAVFAAIDRDVRGPVNLCTGVGTSMCDLAAMMCDMVGYSPTFTFLADKPAGVHHRVGFPARMREFYTPKIWLREGVRRALESVS